MSSYTRPSDDQVREALRRIPTPQLRRAFFEGLKNPLWLEPLKNEGAFRTPPARVVMDDGTASDPYWPEIEYVVRVAGDAPAVAVDILVSLKDSDNAWVRRALFAVGAAVPASEAARLKPVLKSWLSSGFGWRTDPREMVRFAVNLITGGERKTGEWVANALFKPAVPDGSTEPSLLLDEYWYEASVPQVAQALGSDGLPMVLGWLVAYAKAAGRMDGWSLSRPSIKERREMHRGVQDALIDATRDLALERIKTEPRSTVERLLGANLMLARRIAMFVMTAALAGAETEAADVPELVSVAQALLFEPHSRDERCRVEFGELAREISRHEPSALDRLGDFISDGVAVRAGQVRERASRDEEDSDVDTEARVTESTERWEHLWLASVGPSALPEVLARRLSELDDRLGVIEDPLRPPFLITGWTGPNSPMTQEEMAAMSPEELIGHLESWHDLGDGWGPEPSHEGQARELTALVTAYPQMTATASGLVARLRPTYLRALLRGWEGALKAGLELDWDQVEETVRDVLTHGDELDVPREGGDGDDDPDFTWAKQAAVDLLGDLVKKSEPPRVPTERLQRLADLLIDLPSSDQEWAEYVAEDSANGMDPLTLSINERWPIHLRGLLALVGHGPLVPWSDRARAAFLREMARQDPQGASSAVIGEHLGRLMNADETWTEAHVRSWFGDVEGITHGQQIALSTAMAIHRYHSTLYRLLAPSMLAALALSEPIVDGLQFDNSTPRERIGEWAVKALVFGHVGWDDPVVAAFFSSADAVERGAALGHVAWEFMHAESVEDSIRDRFAGVWDARIAHVESNPSDSAELREFFWVVRCRKFDPEWWLPRLKRSLELDPELAAQRYMIGKDIASAADVNARLALDVTMLLVNAPQSRGFAMIEMSRHAIPVVIARALAAGDAQLEIDATEFMNELGEAGNLELAKQVQAVLDGAITQQDVLE